MNIIVPDTSVIIDKRITELLKKEKHKNITVIIPEPLLSELEAQANKGKETGLSGLEELKELSEMAKTKEINIKFIGNRPTFEQIKLASTGEIDSMIRSIAVENKATFVTSDKIQAKIANAKGLEVIYIEPIVKDTKSLIIEDFFTDDTLSVHLKAGLCPMAKKGSVKNQKLVKISDRILTEKELQDIKTELLEKIEQDPDSFYEIHHKDVSVFQIENMRIVVAQPPFSDKMEITAVRPVAKTYIDDYRLSNEIKEILSKKQRGILIAGSPGAGKSTFAASIAEYLNKQGFIVKTMESPRDLQVSEEITQYAPLKHDMEKAADILLLLRPDYTVYDELRKSTDFHIFADMRMAGIGMIGVVHATRAIDAIQRLIGRVELGIIPQVVDTVIFIEKGEISKIYVTEFTVKMPLGMMEKDLARPVITITNLETKKIEYEIYTYGEQVVVMPVSETKNNSIENLAVSEIKREFKKYTSMDIDVDINSENNAIVYVNKEDIPRIIGKSGKNIDIIQEKLGIHIDIKEKENLKVFIPKIEQKKKYILLSVKSLSNKNVDVCIGSEHLFNAKLGKKGEIKIGKNTEVGFKIMKSPSDVLLRLS